jgi:hypothetical protein
MMNPRLQTTAMPSTMKNDADSGCRPERILAVSAAISQLNEHSLW